MYAYMVYVSLYSICIIIWCCVVCGCSVLSNSLWCHGLLPFSLLCPCDFPGKTAGVGCHFLLQGIFPVHGLDLPLLHCQVASLPLHHLGSPITWQLHASIFLLSLDWKRRKNYHDRDSHLSIFSFIRFQKYWTLSILSLIILRDLWKQDINRYVETM